MARDKSITVSHLVKTFGKFLAVDDISFEVESGEIFAFLGPNGAGKTTTIKMLTTLLTPTSGNMTINGYDPVRQPHEVRRSFGIVFQDPSLDDELTAGENLEFHGILYGVKRADLYDRINNLLKFVELSSRRDSQVKTFSGGMRRRLEIARGFLHHPKVIFLDEPTIGLDPQTRNHIWDYISDLNKKEGTTIFFTTQYIEEAQKAAGRVAVIDQGKIRETGTPAALMEKTHTGTLEEAFLSLTGHEIREEEGNAIDQMRMRRRMWHRR